MYWIYKKKVILRSPQQAVPLGKKMEEKNDENMS